MMMILGLLSWLRNILVTVVMSESCTLVLVVLLEVAIRIITPRCRLSLAIL